VQPNLDTFGGGEDNLIKLHLLCESESKEKKRKKRDFAMAKTPITNSRDIHFDIVYEVFLPLPVTLFYYHNAKS
jgi:hypothetical protein